MTEKQPGDDTAATADQQPPSDPSDGSKSALVTPRRGLLAALTTAGGGGLLWWNVGRDENVTPERDDSGGSDGETFGGDEERLISQEIEARAEAREARVSNLPSFDYEPLSETFDDRSEPSFSINAAPADSIEGDRLVLSADEEKAGQLLNMVGGRWVSGTGDASSTVTIEDQSIEFVLYNETVISLGLGILRDSENANVEMLVARGKDRRTVETLIDSFDVFYTEQSGQNSTF